MDDQIFEALTMCFLLGCLAWSVIIPGDNDDSQ